MIHDECGISGKIFFHSTLFHCFVSQQICSMANKSVRMLQILPYTTSTTISRSYARCDTYTSSQRKMIKNHSEYTMYQIYLFAYLVCILGLLLLLSSSPSFHFPFIFSWVYFFGFLPLLQSGVYCYIRYIPVIAPSCST